MSERKRTPQEYAALVDTLERNLWDCSAADMSLVRQAIKSLKELLASPSASAGKEVGEREAGLELAAQIAADAFKDGLPAILIPQLIRAAKYSRPT